MQDKSLYEDISLLKSPKKKQEVDRFKITLTKPLVDTYIKADP
jgi:hypothetical protein